MKRSELDGALLHLSEEMWGSDAALHTLKAYGTIPEQLKGIAVDLFIRSFDQLGDPIETWVELVRDALSQLKQKGSLEFDAE